MAVPDGVDYPAPYLSSSPISLLFMLERWTPSCQKSFGRLFTFLASFLSLVSNAKKC